MIRSRFLLGALLGALALSGCSTTAPDHRGPKVVASLYPLAYAAEQVIGPELEADVVNLAAPGVEPHDLELSAAQVGQIASADLVLYLPGFQPAVDDAVAQQAGDRTLDAYTGITSLSSAGNVKDPHVWLDPRNMATLGTQIAKRLATIDPTNAATYAANAAQLADDMSTLDNEFRTGLATCKNTTLVVSHEAFGYLAKAYGFTEVGLSGLSPEAEPSPARLRQVADLVKRLGVTTIYYETLVDPKIATTIAAETGARTAKLDPLEGLAPNAKAYYGSIMRENLATLRAGQGCA